MLIRKAEKDDIEDLIKMRLAYLAEDFDVDNVLKEKIHGQLSGYFLAHLSHDCVAFVAQDGGLIVSTAFLVIQEKPANPRFPTGKTGLLLNVYTIPKYRRQGIATSLLQTLLDEARTYELSYIELSASPSGEPLYKKLGFVAGENSHYTKMVLPLMAKPF